MSIIGFSANIVSNPTRLIVTQPINPLLVGTVAALTLWPFLMEFRHKPRRRTRLILWGTIAFGALGFFPSGARLVLDRPSNTATLSQLMFFHWVTRSMPLDQLIGAGIRGGGTTDAIALRHADGSITLLSERNPSDGKDTAIAAINAFLDRNHSP